MDKINLITNWPKAFAITIIILILFWVQGCPPKTRSLIEPNKKVTRPELQIELNTITSTALYRFAELEQQEQFRDLILKNALIIVETGTVNPLGIITAFAALYGIGSAGKQVKDKVAKKKNGSTNNGTA